MSSSPDDVHMSGADNKNKSVDHSPHGDSPHHGHTSGGSGEFLIPSPVPTRRNRTYSQSERASAGPTHYGRIKSFCRQKGHGFITPHDGQDEIFLHISDIDGELVPVEGDEVSYKRCPIPPKFEKFSAVHVVIIRAKEGVTHERWDGMANVKTTD